MDESANVLSTQVRVHPLLLSGDQPLGFDMAERIAAARAKEKANR